MAAQFNFTDQLNKIGEFGIIEQVRHPLVSVNGLPGARLHELVLFENGVSGEVFMVGRTNLEVLVFSGTSPKVGARVTRMDKFLSVPVGREILGCAIDPLGFPVSNKKVYQMPKEEREIDVAPKGIMHRSRIKEPLLTGTTIVDMMIPLGKGQKELIIGDRKTGKSAFLLSTIKNQVRLGSIAIYGAIARKKADIKIIQDFFEAEKIADKTVIVATTSYDSPSLIYLTPYSAMAIGEYFVDQGFDVLVILDDLSTHAKFYREISLLAKRFPGRDSYPGDIFYTHAKLLERTGNFKHESGRDVSLSVLPVVETIEGDFTGYIATNIMGMTDGHLYFDSNLYYRGRRPAVNISISVTRVGRQTQTNLLRSTNRELTSFITLYEKMQNLSHFGAELTDGVKQTLKTGEAIYNFFEQPYGYVVPQAVQIALFSLVWIRAFSDYSPDMIAKYRQGLINAYGDSGNKPVFEELLKVKDLNAYIAEVQKNKEKLLGFCQAKPI